MRSNIVPPEALQEAIIAKTKSVQQAEASKQQAIAAQADGQRKVAVAKADSAETIINASAQALSIRLKQKELTSNYIEFKKIEKWDGKLPTTMAGNSGSLINIK
jgi:regulator of protease activity HflC (stomatin/prohibitin superfamily)